jgi:hypothetical protein
MCRSQPKDNVRVAFPCAPQCAILRTWLHNLGNSWSNRFDKRLGAVLDTVQRWLGQFVDHNIALETESAALPELVAPDLIPPTPDQIEDNLQNGRTATLELDSVYGVPGPRDGAGCRLGMSPRSTETPLFRPPGKDDDNDLLREGRSNISEFDRAAKIGNACNDKNTLFAHLHIVFLRANNELVR